MKFKKLVLCDLKPKPLEKELVRGLKRLNEGKTLGVENILLTPTYGRRTRGAQENRVITIGNARKFLEGRPPNKIV
jgi:pSer/pThr/pTyr-binding forkhead associated (FHA) protein